MSVKLTATMIDARVGKDQVLEHVTQTIVEHLRPRRIVLFGSRARGDAKADSDYDIMVEMETDLQGSRREGAVYDLFPRHEWSMDVLVYTPDEVRRKQDDVGTVVYDIVREGRVLYCRPDVGDGGFGSGVVEPASPRVRERPAGVPESLASWIRRAREDFALMQAAANLEPPARGGVCFHAHQLVEKLLKACLISRSIHPPRTHNLPKLLSLCVGVGFDLEPLRPACKTLYHLWPKSRYPDDDGEPTSSDAQAAVEAATAIRDAVLPLLERAG